MLYRRISSGTIISSSFAVMYEIKASSLTFAVMGGCDKNARKEKLPKSHLIIIIIGAS